MPMRPGRLPQVGLLFNHDWDAEAFGRLAGGGGGGGVGGVGGDTGGMAHFDSAGFDLFSFPSNAALIGFDLQRFADRQARRGRRRGWAAVLSHHEQFGALAAALVAEQLGLPGATPEAVLAAQHKLHARRVLQAVAPEANIAFQALDVPYGHDMPDGLDYPTYVKPVKAAFSVLARQVDSRSALQAHTRFGRRELWVIRRLVEPFEQVARQRLPEAGSAHRLMLEAPLPASTPQYNLDGWVQGGQIHALGVVDAVMYPGTQAFMRWQLPSALPADVQARALDVARRFLAAIGFGHGFFNMEFFFDPATQRLAVIEFNPRLASQFGDLYQRVQGRDPHAMSLALALGQDPLALPRRTPSAGIAASLVYRSFNPALVPAMPGLAARQALHQAFADALLYPMPKAGHGLARDFKWLGSHRYGIVHLGGRDAADLQRRARQASALLGWPAPWLDGAGADAGADAHAHAEDGSSTAWAPPRPDNPSPFTTLSPGAPL